jgi:hypothetical protein
MTPLPRRALRDDRARHGVRLQPAGAHGRDLLGPRHAPRYRQGRPRHRLCVDLQVPGMHDQRGPRGRLDDPSRWIVARLRLGHALRHRPERFDRTWESKARFSMDWFYPVLTGVLQRRDAQRRLDARWDEFVERWHGLPLRRRRTLGDRGRVLRARARPARGRPHPAARRSCSAGCTPSAARTAATGPATSSADAVLWPDERPTWTSAAILLAADALAEATKAHRLFTRVELPEPSREAERLHHLQLLEQS